MGSWAKIGILIASGTLVAVLLSEWGLRLIDPSTFQKTTFPMFDWVVFDPVMSWQNKAGFDSENVTIRGKEFQANIHVNSQGFRGDEVADKKPDGVLRIVCLGDSSTFGITRLYGFTREPQSIEASFDSYPGELAKLLIQEGYRNIEVINAGVIGYHSSQGLRQLITQVLDLQPNIVTARFGINDHARAWNPALLTEEPESTVQRRLLYVFSDWRLLRLFMGVYQSIQPLHLEANSVEWVDPDRFQRNLRRMVEISHENDFKLMLIDYPLRPLALETNLGEDLKNTLMGRAATLEKLHQRHNEYQTLQASTARALGTPLLKTKKALHESDVATFSAYDPIHPTKAGAVIIAELMLRQFQELDWIPPRPDEK